MANRFVRSAGAVRGGTGCVHCASVSGDDDDANHVLYQNELSTWQQATSNMLMLKAGQFTAEELRHAITTDAMYLIAGPAAMTRANTKLLRKAGVPANDICYEPFSF